MIKRASQQVALICLALGLVACEGELQIRLTDAAADSVSEVNVRITGLELLSGSGTEQTYDFDDRDIDLLDLQNGITFTLVDDDEASSGSYTGIRLLIEADAIRNRAGV